MIESTDAAHATDQLIVGNIGAEQQAVASGKPPIDRVERHLDGRAGSIGREVVRRVASVGDDAVHQRLQGVRVRKVSLA